MREESMLFLEIASACMSADAKSVLKTMWVYAVEEPKVEHVIQHLLCGQCHARTIKKQLILAGIWEIRGARWSKLYDFPQTELVEKYIGHQWSKGRHMKEWQEQALKISKASYSDLVTMVKHKQAREEMELIKAQKRAEEIQKKASELKGAYCRFFKEIDEPSQDGEDEV